MRQIKSFIHSVRRMLEITEFTATRYRIENAFLTLHDLSHDTVIIRHKYGNQIMFYKNSVDDDLCVVGVTSFGKKGFQNHNIDLNLEDEVDYFNYIVQNNPGKLTLDDIEVLKEIRELALKVLNNEKTVH